MKDVLAEPKYAISVDFDGVIHRYDSPWKDAAHIPDPPVDGAIEWVTEMTKHYYVVIHSTRCKDLGGPPAMAAWLKKHGMKEEVIKKLYFHAEKPAAIIYIDDRGWTFDGTFPSLEQLRNFKPWNKK